MRNISRIEILRERHQALDDEADRLSSSRFLSPNDQQRLKWLKVMRLKVKDLISSLETEEFEALE